MLIKKVPLREALRAAQGTSASCTLPAEGSGPGRQVALTLLQLRGHTAEEDTLSHLSDQEVVDLLDIRSGLEWATPRASTPRALAKA